MHFSFLSAHFWAHSGATAEFREEAFWRLFFPFLLFTKPRQKTAEVVWDAVGKCLSSGVGLGPEMSLGWLKGCLELVAEGGKGDEEDSMERMLKLDFAVAEKIAGRF